jgi:K+/H+ antiporter YhaU regulatory subunit KhtT
LSDHFKFPKIRNLIKSENFNSRLGKKEDIIYKTSEKNDVFLSEQSIEYQMNKFIKKNGLEER